MQYKSVDWFLYDVNMMTQSIDINGNVGLQWVKPTQRLLRHNKLIGLSRLNVLLRLSIVEPRPRLQKIIANFRY